MSSIRRSGFERPESGFLSVLATDCQSCGFLKGGSLGPGRKELGNKILALFAVFEKRRNDVLRMLEQIKQWS